MILYATKETFERFKLKLPGEMSDPLIGALSQAVIDQEQGDRLLEWGAKLFYFDRRKCIQVVNFASKLTFFLVSIKMDNLPEIGNLIAGYMMNLYADDRKMKRRLEKFFEDHPVVAFSRLKDKSAIATLNRTQTYYLDDGYRLGEYIEDGILHTKKINKDVNRDWYFTEKINGKTEYFQSADKFRELLLKRYP